MECGICKIKNPELLQEHHWRYNPEIKSVLCIFCHLAQHSHGVGRGLISDKDKLIILSFIIRRQKEITYKDLYKFYLGQTYRKLKTLEKIGFLKRKKFTEYPAIYEIKLEQQER